MSADAGASELADDAEDQDRDAGVHRRPLLIVRSRGGVLDVGGTYRQVPPEELGITWGT